MASEKEIDNRYDFDLRAIGINVPNVVRFKVCADLYSTYIEFECHTIENDKMTCGDDGEPLVHTQRIDLSNHQIKEFGAYLIGCAARHESREKDRKEIRSYLNAREWFLYNQNALPNWKVEDNEHRWSVFTAWKSWKK